MHPECGGNCHRLYAPEILLRALQVIHPPHVAPQLCLNPCTVSMLNPEVNCSETDC
jgi:hypothetical protein